MGEVGVNSKSSSTSSKMPLRATKTPKRHIPSKTKGIAIKTWDIAFCGVLDYSLL